MAEPDLLGQEAAALLENQETQLYLSVVSSWEIAIKAKLGKLPLPQPPQQYIEDVLKYLSLIPLEIKNHHALHTYSLPIHHKDPFDRLLIAQAQTEKLYLMSADKQFRRYEIDLIWAAD